MMSNFVDADGRAVALRPRPYTPRPPGDRRRAPGPPHLTPGELVYIKKYWSHDVNVRRWLAELGES